MREGLLTIGIILLVLGAIFYFVPAPASATANEPTTMPWLQTLSLWGMIIGTLLTLLGLFLPSEREMRAHPEQPLTAPGPAEPTEAPSRLTKRERRKLKIKATYRRH